MKIWATRPRPIESEALEVGPSSPCDNPTGNVLSSSRTVTAQAASVSPFRTIWKDRGGPLRSLT